MLFRSIWRYSAMSGIFNSTTRETSKCTFPSSIIEQFLRYGSDGQLILNPGSIGQPFFLDAKLRKDLRAQYMILEFDESGLSDVDFRRVDYDVEAELQLAKDLKLPYFQIYYESLVNGIHHTHNHELLVQISEQEGYDQDVC